MQSLGFVFRFGVEGELTLGVERRACSGIGSSGWALCWGADADASRSQVRLAAMDRVALLVITSGDGSAGGQETAYFIE